MHQMIIQITRLLLCLVLYGMLGDASVHQWAYDYPEDEVFQRQSYDVGETEELLMDLKMPGVFPRQDDAYLCTQIQAPENTAYITEFEPLASMTTAHHMLLFGCGRPWTMDDVWDCGSMAAMCQGATQIMYAWARDAPPTTIPKDVGFHIGGDSGISYLVLQIHYAHAFRDGQDLDHSGLSLHMTYKPQKFMAGMYLLASGYAHIPAHSKGVTVDLACGYEDPVEIHPFAFRTHTHTLGRVVSGYVVRNGQEWVELGRGNPQWPQAFYPMANAKDKVIWSTDIVAARCVYDAESKEEDTWIGSTSADEMCNFYMMYYTDPERGSTFKECSYPGDSEFFADIPDTSFIVPDAPEGGGLKEGWQEHVHMHHHNHGHSQGIEEEEMKGMDETTAGKTDVSARTKSHTTTLASPELKTPKQHEDNSDETTGRTNTVVREQHQTTEASGKQTEEEQSSSEDSTEASQATELRLVQGWPDESSVGHLGQVAGVGMDSSGNVVIFHRGDHVWDAWTFDSEKQYKDRAKGPISTNTVITLNPQTGKSIHQWGKDFFYLPHGLTLDHQDNVWVTDVAMHQVFKFPPGGGDKPLLTLGEKFVPDWSTDHFCQPTDVAVEKSGDFYVSDGYCNSRVLKFDKTGKLLAVLGEVSHKRHAEHGFSLATQMVIPHSLALAEDRKQVCTADRENGRVVCFNTETGKPVRTIQHPEFGKRLFAISYSPAQGGLLHAVNGPTDPPQTPVQGFTMTFDDGEIIDTWPEKAFENPHDVTCASHNSAVYVVEIGPNKVWKLEPSKDQPWVKKGDGSSHGSTADNPPPTLLQEIGTHQPHESLLQTNDESHRILKLPTGGNLREDLSTTLIIATVLVVPLIIVVIIAAVVRCRASGNLRFDKRKKSTLKSWMNGYKEKHQNGGLFTNKKGFQRVKTEDSDHEEDPLTDSEVEEYNAVRSV